MAITADNYKRPIGRLGVTASIDLNEQGKFPMVWLRDNDHLVLLMPHELRDLRDLINSLPLED